MTTQTTNLNLRRFLTKINTEILPHLDTGGQPPDKKWTLGLTGLYLSSEAGMPLEHAGKYVVDGGEDFGIDGMYFNAATQTLYLIQTKFRNNQNKSIAQADVLKFINGIDRIIHFDISKANKKIKNAYRDISHALEDINTRIKLCIVTTSSVDVAPNCSTLLDEFCNKQNEYDTVFSWEYVKFDRVFQMAKFFSYTKGTNVEIKLHEISSIKTPYNAYFGYVSGSDVASWVKQHGASLFEQNVRFTLQNSDVNEGILSSIRETPNSFWYLNNGITAIAGKVKVTPGDTNPRKIVSENMNIVNGAQTAGMLARASEENVDLSEIKVNFRIISLENTPPGFDEEITRANNTQNELNALDFVSLDPMQDLIRTDLASKGFNYVFKRGADVDENLTTIEVKDAAVALACSNSDISISVQAKRYVSGLWNNIKAEPYTKIFHKDITGDEIISKWKIYILCNSAIKAIKNSASKDDTLIFSHGDKFICYCVFKYLRENEIRLSDEDRILEVVNRIAKALPDVYRATPNLGYPATTFKNTKSQAEIESNLFVKLDSEL